MNSKVQLRRARTGQQRNIADALLVQGVRRRSQFPIDVRGVLSWWADVATTSAAFEGKVNSPMPSKSARTACFEM